MNISAFSSTGRRIAHIGGVSCFTAWQCLQASLAARFECEPDDIHILEDDDGVERLTLRGEVVGYVTTEIGGITFGIPDAPSIVPDAPGLGSDAPGIVRDGPVDVPVTALEE